MLDACAAAMAGHLALVERVCQQEAVVAQLEWTLERCRRIEQARGMLVERLGVDGWAAFELLCRMARSSHRSVVPVARDLLRDRVRAGGGADTRAPTP